MMMKVKELAKELGMTGKECLDRLKAMGIAVSAVTDDLDDETVELVKDELSASTGLASAGPKQRIEIMGDEILLEGSVTVQEFADAVGLKGPAILQALIKMGRMLPLTSVLDEETAVNLAEKLGYRLVVMEEETVELVDASRMKPRPPVVTVMGHVDHGKTTLLDAIRATQVAEREAGGITQHIGASCVDLPEGRVVFLDTPGHEAFTQLRARGAHVTDIVILIVAADDGVMPQTIEAINHARDAEVPIIVAINKTDKPNADVEKVKHTLVAQDLVPEEWGGSTQMVCISAKKREGIRELLELVLLQADVMNLKAEYDTPAEGVIIESRLDKGKGPVATVLIRKGTLHVGDCVVSGLNHGRLRALLDWQGKNIDFATPAIPVEILGLSSLPNAGDVFSVVACEKDARDLTQQRQDALNEQKRTITTKISFDDLFTKLQTGSVRELKTVIKSDVQGSLEAIEDSLNKITVGDVKIKVIHKGIGSITDNDIMLASASGAVVIGFNVRPTSITRKIATREKVEIRTYRVIYDLLNDVRAALEGMLEPEYKEVILGSAEVRQIFSIPKIGKIAGCYVTNGKILRSGSMRLIRDGIVVWEGKIAALRRFKDDAREVAQGFECGISLDGFSDLKSGDYLECFEMQEIKRT
ncbi:translation initiation factor IF-2 [bacterium]|nr:translation initiation factor IF-2 [candidate division CSSED10-310 bacterium]